MKKYIYITAVLLGSISAKAQYTKDINTTRPSSSMGAYSVSKGIFQIEGGYTYQNDEFHTEKVNTSNNFNLQLRYGEMLENLEFVADLYFSSYNQTDYNLDLTNSGFRQLNLRAKVVI